MNPLYAPGVLETRWYAQLGVPAFAYGPGALEVSHGPDEYVEVRKRFRAEYAPWDDGHASERIVDVLLRHQESAV